LQQHIVPSRRRAASRSDFRDSDWIETRPHPHPREPEFIKPEKPERVSADDYWPVDQKRMGANNSETFQNGD